MSGDRLMESEWDRYVKTVLGSPGLPDSVVIPLRLAFMSGACSAVLTIRQSLTDGRDPAEVFSSLLTEAKAFQEEMEEV